MPAARFTVHPNAEPAAQLCGNEASAPAAVAVPDRRSSAALTLHSLAAPSLMSRHAQDYKYTRSRFVSARAEPPAPPLPLKWQNRSGMVLSRTEAGWYSPEGGVSAFSARFVSAEELRAPVIIAFLDEREGR